MNIGTSPDLAYQIIMVCIGVAGLAFFAALYFTGKSKKDARREIKIGLKEIYTVGTAVSERIESLDGKYLDSIGTLSQAANQNYSLAKQFLSLLERRVEKVNDLLSTRKIEDLFKAHKIITSPLENAGDHLSSLVFSTTILQLKPGEFELALNTMIDSVEKELYGGKVAKSYSTSGYAGQRKKRFTIRSFVQSITGEGESKD